MTGFYPLYQRAPDVVLYQTDLGDSAWEAKSGIVARGVQATFDIPVEGETANGLRITLARSLLEGDRGNVVTVVSLVDSTLSAATAVYVAATMTLTITHSSGNQAFTAVKTAVDANTGISSSYYGNAAGADIASEASGLFSGGIPDRPAYVRVTVGADMLIKFATSVPANTADSTSRIAMSNKVYEAIIPAGERFYSKRRVATDVIGGIEMWHLR